MKNILIAMNDAPYPPYSGGKIDFFYKLKVLKDLGCNIYLIYSYSHEEDDKKFKQVACGFVAKLVSYPRKKNLKDLLSFIPYYIISSKPDNEDKNQIDAMLANINIDVILIDHLNSSLIGEYVIKKYPQSKVILRMHNNESVFLYSLFKTFKITSPKKILLGFDALKMWLYENKKYDIYENISAISLAEAKKIKKNHLNKNIKWIPPFFDFNASDEIILDDNENKEYLALQEKLYDKKVLIITGSFNGGFNVKSTEWFIANVFKHLVECNKNIIFIIAGLDSDKHFLGNKNILVIPKYNSVKPLMKIADLSIILSAGKGGVKLKLMEALNYRKKIVSTIDGVYGSGFEELLPNTDDKKIFFSYCMDALDGRIDYQEAYSYFKSRFNCKRNGLEMINE